MVIKGFPRCALVTKKSVVTKPSHPVIDAHNHLGETFGGGWDQRPVTELLKVMDAAEVRLLVDLDGGWGEDILHRHLDHFKAKAPERFKVFGGVDWEAWKEKGNRFPEWAANRLREQARQGAEGLKIWKPFGLTVTDDQGALVKVDDPRLDPIWQTAGDLKLPVMVHVADPVAFFWSVDEDNERFEELQGHPDWSFPSPPFPPFEEIVNGMAHVVERHVNTTFIGAHVGWYSENLDWVGSVLDRCPNFYVDFAARMGEIGRQPYSARKFFLKYSDRILFGTDHPANVHAYQLHYRFLETDDEYFDYTLSGIPGQGRWKIYGLYLPGDVLEKIYYQNARRVLG
ncbi:MAG TPA: amidohydrolase family protein [Anaerolineaceae bacterium]